MNKKDRPRIGKIESLEKGKQKIRIDNKIYESKKIPKSYF